ncbi:MAG: hypothetical protein R2932_57280 [Caldilineaceae bacterium]
MPLIASVKIEQSRLQIVRMITAEWNIQGAKEVYFDYGRGPFDLVVKDILWTEELRHGIDFGFETIPDEVGEEEQIWFRWKIVLDDGTERIIARQLIVQKKDLTDEEKADGEKETKECKKIPDRDEEDRP